MAKAGDYNVKYDKEGNAYVESIPDKDQVSTPKNITPDASRLKGSQKQRLEQVQEYREREASKNTPAMSSKDSPSGVLITDLETGKTYTTAGT